MNDSHNKTPTWVVFSFTGLKMFGSSLPRPHSLPTHNDWRKRRHTSEGVDAEVDESRNASLEPLDLLLSGNGKFGSRKD